MKKKILAVSLCVVMLAIAIVGGTLAYFTDTKTATNTFTVGNVKIELTEPGWEGSGKTDAPEVYPGEPLKKDPTVKNTGSNPCFVRIKVTGLDCLGTGDMMIKYRTDYVNDKLGEGWKLHTDGYFYYTGVLAVGAETDALFDQIVIPTGLTNDTAENPSHDVIVTAEAVQAQGAKARWADVQTMTVDEIAAWFTTCMPASTPVTGE